MVMCTELKKCFLVSQEVGLGCRQVLDIAQLIGGEFLRIKEDSPIGCPAWEIDPKPWVIMEKDGNLSDLTFSHHLFERSSLEHKSLGSHWPTADFDFLQADRIVSFSQSTLENITECESLARGQFAVARIFYPHLHPSLGWVGQFGDNMPSGKSVSKTELKYIFWANFFGPSYVEKFGRKFLLGAPGWKKEELDDGGILYVVTENYYDWRTKPPKEVLEYFRDQVPGIKLYRAKSSDY